MQEVLVTAGIVFIAGAIIGGGLSAFKIEMPVITSIARQLTLGLFGVALLAVGMLSDGSNGDDGGGTTTSRTTVTTTGPGSTTSTTGGGGTGCRITIVNPLVSMNETPEHQGQESAKVPPGEYAVLDTTITPFAGRDERWFKIQVGTRQGWIPDDTILIDSKSDECP